jgi:hypothetical protein
MDGHAWKLASRQRDLHSNRSSWYHVLALHWTQTGQNCFFFTSNHHPLIHVYPVRPCLCPWSLFSTWPHSEKYGTAFVASFDTRRNLMLVYISILSWLYSPYDYFACTFLKASSVFIANPKKRSYITHWSLNIYNFSLILLRGFTSTMNNSHVLYQLN